MDQKEAAELAEIAVEMASQTTLNETLAEIIERARQTTSGDAAGVMIRHRDRVEPLAATNPLVQQADALQLSCGEGPCLAAALAGPDFTIISDAATDERWPIWGPKVADLGWHSVLSLRLSTSNEVLGALNIYARTKAAFDDDDADIAGVFGRHASVALASALEVSNLRKAISARHVVGQAQGILMERFDVNSEQAFSILRRYSQDNNVKLRVIADHVIRTRRLP